MEITDKYSQPAVLPFKSVAGALLFSAFLGPIGVLYATFWGGVILIVLAFIVISAQYAVPIIVVWLVGCIWSVASVNKYNKKRLLEMQNQRK